MAAVSSRPAGKCSLVKVGTLKIKDVNCDPLYTGAVCLPGHGLVLVDNNIVTLHDVKTGELLATSDQLPGPWDVCVLKASQSKIAVSSVNGEIRILTVRPNGQPTAIRLEKTIKTNLEICFGVNAIRSRGKFLISGYYHGKLCWSAVSLSSDKPVGEIHEICQYDDNSFSYLSTSKDQSCVYISYYAGYTPNDTAIYGYDVDSGRQKFIYRHKDLTCPHGICLDNRGFIYVCDKWPDYHIHQLTQNGEPGEVFRDGIPKKPQAICFNENQELLITSHGSNEICIFKLEWDEQEETRKAEDQQKSSVFRSLLYTIRFGRSRQKLAHKHSKGSLEEPESLLGYEGKHSTLEHPCSDELKDLETNKPAIPVEILLMDSRSLQMYREALRDGTEKVYNIRVMVVGQYGVGKTTLTKRLLQQAVDISERKSTEGIGIHLNCCKVSLETWEWTTHNKEADQLDRFQRLVKLLNDQIHEVSNTQEIKKVISHQREVTSERDSDNGDTTHSDTLRQHKQLSSEQDSEGETASMSGASINGELMYGAGHIGSDVSGAVLLGSEGYVSNESERSDPTMELLNAVNKSAYVLGENRENFATLTLWDFAGQFVFYTTHQTFLTRRAIYLLVTDLGQQVTDIVNDECFFDREGMQLCKVHDLAEVWLNSIHSCASSHESSTPPVILVGTHADKIEQNSLHEVSANYFRQIRFLLNEKPTRFHLVDEDFVVDNTLCNPRLEALKRKIVELASKQPYWGEEVPARWLPLEHRLMVLKASGIKVVRVSILEDLNQAGSVRIETREELHLFLRFQHEMGSILYFSVEGLRENVILDPQWLIDALKSLITAEMFILLNYPGIMGKWFELKEKGKLTPELIDAIWTKERHPEFHDNKEHILRVMEQLNIVAKPSFYGEDGGKIKEKYLLAPCMLRQKTPIDVIRPRENTQLESTPVLCFVFNGKYLPPAVFHRLLAACLAQWSIARMKSQNLIFCGCCVFELDVHHRLTLYSRDYTIFARVTRMGITEKTPSSTLCIAAKEFINLKLSEITGHFGQCLQYELHIQCTQFIGEDSIDSLIPVKLLQENNEVTCHSHDDGHVILSRDLLKFWFKDKKAEDVEEVDSDQPITQEHINYARLCNALLTVCTEALRDILINHIPAPHLSLSQAILANKANLTKRRQGQRQNALLNKDQCQIVFPDPQDQYTGTVDKFDISLLYTLIRNVSTVTAPGKGWGNQPRDLPRDTCLGASVERIRLLRNKFTGHSGEGKVSQREFKDCWKMIEDILHDIEKRIGSRDYQSELDRRKKQAITPHEAHEQRKKIRACVKAFKDKLFADLDALADAAGS
ncbi:hypothetical protein ACJMK2_004570 [Sinanodonta woodiana]|uniref:non-specific serine/threonine protein kinase n=1 Tax=Sinanodonta woodiana TaxID=1069815 RepID=A0ABD3Y3G4_SINWO